MLNFQIRNDLSFNHAMRRSMRFELIAICMLICYLFAIESQGNEEVAIEFEISEDTDAHQLAQQGCLSRYLSCERLAVPSIQKYKHMRFGNELYNWRYNEHCRCNFPPQKALSKLQYLHIPKTGTSFNWLLHSYFDNCEIDQSNPCSRFLTNVSISCIC
jgi:hypothetical protein